MQVGVLQEPGLVRVEANNSMSDADRAPIAAPESVRMLGHGPRKAGLPSPRQGAGRHEDDWSAGWALATEPREMEGIELGLINYEAISLEMSM